MANETVTLGVVGQMYQNRKKPEEVGVLESRDEKHKALFFRDADGKSFNVQYSTFRSYWRKYTGEEVVETSTQKEQKAQKKARKVEQAKENLAEPKKKANKNSDDRRKNPMSEEDLAKLQDDGALIIRNAFDKANIDLFTLEQKYVKKSNQTRSTIRCNGKEIAEIWIMKDKHNIGNSKFFMPEEPFKKAVFSKSVGEIEAVKSTNPKEKRPISFKLSTDKLELAIIDLLKSLKTVYGDKVKKEKKEKK